MKEDEIYRAGESVSKLETSHNNSLRILINCFIIQFAMVIVSVGCIFTGFLFGNPMVYDIYATLFYTGILAILVLMFTMSINFIALLIKLKTLLKL